MTETPARARSNSTLADLLRDRAHHTEDSWDSAVYLEAAERLESLATIDERMAQAIARAEIEALGDHVSIVQIREIVREVIAND